MTRVTPFGAGLGLMAVAAMAALLAGCDNGKPPSGATEFMTNIQKAWKYRFNNRTYDVTEYTPASHPGMTCTVVVHNSQIAQSCFPKQMAP